MRTCPFFSVGRHRPLGRRPLSVSLVRSSSVVAPTGSPGSHSQATASPIIHKGPSKTPTSTSSFASLAARHPPKLQHAHTLTILHTTRELVTRIFPQSSELSFWNAVLGEVSHEISRSNLTSNGDSVTIVVYAVDEFSGGESLVSALVQDPFSPEAERVRISRRWEGHEHDTRLEIEYSVSPVEDTKSSPEGPSPSPSHILRSSSSFLASMPSPTRIIELRPTRELSQDNLRLLYTAHIPIILLNPLTTPLTTLSSHQSSNNPKPAVLPYPLPPHALLLITSPSPISTSSSVPPAVFELGVSPNRVFLVDPDRALSSIHSLRTNPSDVLHVQRYSDDALASGLSVLKCQLQSIPTPAQKGEALLTTSIRVLRSRLDGVEAETREAAALTRTLLSETSHERADAHRAVFGPAQERPGPASSSDHSNNKVRAAMARATDDVLPVLATLTWWRVLWAPDEVSWRMRQAVRDAWVGSIASGLLPALATLPSTQATHANRALSRTAALPPALHSHVLLNALNQLTHAPSFAVEPRALLRPLDYRLARLDAGPTAALARAAQVLLLRVAGSVGAGAATGAMILSHGVGEAAGAGLFVVAAGIRWAIGRWDKARKMWRADWARVREAAERDVKAALDQALETQVLIVPTRAAEGIKDIVTKREDDTAQLRGEVDKLDAIVSDSQNLEHRSPDHS